MINDEYILDYTDPFEEQLYNEKCIFLWSVLLRSLQNSYGLDCIHGLLPTPRIEYKFQPQKKDCVGGNDFLYQSFGVNAERRHKQFKCFLVCQDPGIAMPSKDQYPNWKVKPLISWINYSCPKAWALGCALAVDKMTMRFQGRHHVGMDNLYNLKAFCRAAYNHPWRVLCHGVTRKSGSGIPACVFQEEIQNKN